MDKIRFRVLYREFLFRMVDRELLSAQAQGDAGKLLGRFAAILIWISIGFGAMALGIRGSGSRDSIVLSALAPEHSIIAATMLIVGLFSVLSWDSMLPDRRDVFILTPLPVSTFTIVLAKTAALAAALGVSVAVFNAIPGVLFPFALAPAGANLLDMVFSVQLYRTVAAYWVTMLLAGTFILCSVVCVQAIAAQLPRALSLRLSSILQIATFCVCVGTYFLQPSLTSAEMLAAQSNRLGYLPSYWFLGLFQQLNGLPGGPLKSAMTDLAIRAWTALAFTVGCAAAGFLLCCFGTLRKIAEAHDIVPTRRKRAWAWRFGSPLDTGILQFSIRTLIRSRQHRVLVAFYSGVGFAIAILFLNTPSAHQLSATLDSDPARIVSLPLLGSSLVMMSCWILGIRAAFAIPIDLRANWIFRLGISREIMAPVVASRKALYVLGLTPCYAVAAATFLWCWPSLLAARHLVVLCFLGLTLSMLCLTRFHKIPFTCSYLPGKSNLHITFALCLMLGLKIMFWAADYERRALFEKRKYFLLLAVLAIGAALAWWRMNRALKADFEGLRFDEEIPPVVMGLGLNRDVVTLSGDGSRRSERFPR